MLSKEEAFLALEHAEKAMKEDGLSEELQKDKIIRSEYYQAAYDRLEKTRELDEGRR